MSWRDRLVWADESNQQRKKASFRGATFFIRDSDSVVGRRNVVHQYPFRDDPYVEDLGQDTDDFTINGYVVQNADNNQDYIDERDALIKALRQSGSGTLVHPYYGEMIVSLVGKARISESFTAGGIAYFSMTFVKVSNVRNLFVQQAPSPKTVADHQEAVDQAVEKSGNYAKDGFYNKYDPTSMPGFTSSSVTSAIGSLNSMLRSVMSGVQAAFPSQVSRAVAYLATAYAEIDATKITETCNLVTSIIGMFNGLNSILGVYGEILSDQLLGPCSSIVYGYYSGPMSGAKVLSTTVPGGTQLTGFADSTMERSSLLSESLGKTAVRAALAINLFGEEKGSSTVSPYGGGLTPVIINTTERARQSANLVSIINLVRVNAILTAARGAVRVKYTSYDSAIEIMNEIADEMEAFLLKSGNDSIDTDYDDYDVTISDPQSYNAIDSLRPVFVEAMKGIGSTLPRPVDYEVPAVTMSSLVLAYDRYYDLDRESDIIERNVPLVKHPGFLPSGQTMGILDA